MKKQMNKKFWRTFFSVFLDALLIVAVILIFLWMKKIAYYSFSNEPYQKESKKQLEIQIKEADTVREVANELEYLGVIEDKNYVLLRYNCSTYHVYQLCPGKYQVSPNMGVDDLLDEFTGR